MESIELREPVILDIPADPASLGLMRGLVERIVHRMEFPREEADRMVLAVDEACSNIIRHAYGNLQGGRIVVTFGIYDDRLEVRIRDFASPADPQTFRARDLEKVRPGGLGMHFMRSAVDEMEYELPPDGGMLLKMVKYRVNKEVPET
ncbi:MAG: ATP-binding protein [Syntrophobacteraceae bacterium]|jgi:anti-sigma regulatory factor (Ser/Thr protein kinase)|nr:ATP-binding protein [Syntrophobacteraceae bacterium]